MSKSVVCSRVQQKPFSLKLYMHLFFTSVIRANPDRDGIDFHYHYQILDEGEKAIRVFHLVLTSVGAEVTWNLNAEKQFELTEIGFPLVVDYFKRYWAEKGELPDEVKEHFEGRDLIRASSERKLSWQDFVLELK